MKTNYFILLVLINIFYLQAVCFGDTKNGTDKTAGCFSNMEQQADSGLTVDLEKIPEQIGVINDTRVRLRAEPNLKSKTLMYFNIGDKVSVIGISTEKQNINGRKSYWYQVRSYDNPDGWVFGTYVDLSKNGLAFSRIQDEERTQAGADYLAGGGIEEDLWILRGGLDESADFEADGIVTEEEAARMAELDEQFIREIEIKRNKRLAWLIRNIASDWKLTEEEMKVRYGILYDLKILPVGHTDEIRNDYITYVYTYPRNNIYFSFYDIKYNETTYFIGWAMYPGFTISNFVCPKTKTEWYEYFGKEYSANTFGGQYLYINYFINLFNRFFIFDIKIDDDFETILYVSCYELE
jgi:hypothetical protein